MIDATQENEETLLHKVKEARDSGAAVSAILKTDERVFARITDGIYREPASALRELIANAYDADATEVRIETDAPRFSRIVIRDNGQGLTENALVHVICHIGGSLKRSLKGKEFHVVNDSDPTLSPKNRKLIGKLGIGLFSVSQLTHHLCIVTKVEGENVRRVCDMLLMPQRDEQLSSGSVTEEKFITGKVQITTVPAPDLDTHGTEITLLEIRPFVRESLQSTALWASIDPEPPISPEESVTDIPAVNNEREEISDIAEDDDFIDTPPIPEFHIGRVSRTDPELLVVQPKVPWSVEDSPSECFEKLVTGIQKLDTGNSKTEKIKLNNVLDTYFRTIWTLSLSIPIPYLAQHPFSLTNDAEIDIYSLSNKPVRPRAEGLDLLPGQTIRDRCKLVTQETSSPLPFIVIFDGIELKRPLEFPRTNIILDSPKPIIFVGKINSDMTSLPPEYSGGPIEFEAYFYRHPRIVPADHNGVMIRINGASGILFDDTFLKYQISEQNRLRQISGEIFIVKGLDAALNIDRESFNVAHPHYQFLRKWVHHSLRQIMSRLKALGKDTKDTHLQDSWDQAVSDISEIVVKESKTHVAPQDVLFASGQLDLCASRQELVFSKETVFSPRTNIKLSTKTDKFKEALIEEKIKAIAAVLQDYGVFATMNTKEKDELLRKIVAIFTIEIK